MWRVLASFFYRCGNFIIRMVSSHLPKGRDAPSNCSPSPLCIEPSFSMISGHPLSVSAFAHSLSLLLKSLGSCLTWAPSLWEPLSLDLSAFRPFGIHRDSSPVTRGRAAVSTQLGEAQVSSDPGCVEFEIKPNILLTAKPGASQVK